MPSRRRSSSLNRDGNYHNHRHHNHHLGSPDVAGFGVGPAPRLRSVSAHSRRYSSGNTKNATNKTTTRIQQNRGRGHSRSESSDHFSQSSPTLSLSSNSGSGHDFYHRHHHHHHHHQLQRKHYSSKQQQQEQQSQRPNFDVFTSNSIGKNIQRQRGDHKQFASQRLLVSTSHGGSSDAGSVHSAPHQTQQQYVTVASTASSSIRNYPTSRLVVVERRDPPSTTKTAATSDSTVPFQSVKSKSSASLPYNYKLVAKQINRVIDGTIF
jgi:hypothetical protein